MLSGDALACLYVPLPGHDVDEYPPFLCIPLMSHIPLVGIIECSRKRPTGILGPGIGEPSFQ